MNWKMIRQASAMMKYRGTTPKKLFEPIHRKDWREIWIELPRVSTLHRPLYTLDMPIVAMKAGSLKKVTRPVLIRPMMTARTSVIRRTMPQGSVVDSSSLAKISPPKAAWAAIDRSMLPLIRMADRPIIIII